MTVCIAALANTGTSAVLVTDSMSTYPVGGFVVETEVPKVRIVGESAVLAAGVSAFSDEIIELLSQWVVSSPSRDFIELAVLAYVRIRQAKTEGAYLYPRGLDWSKFYENHSSLNGEIARQIDNELTTFDLGVRILAVSPLGGRYRIGSIWNPGVMNRLDSNGFACIGSGEAHAAYAMLDMGYAPSMSVDRVRDLVCLAKEKSSQRTVGVGGKTVIKILPEGIETEI